MKKLLAAREREGSSLLLTVKRWTSLKVQHSEFRRGQDMRGGAETRDADPLTLQFLGRFDIGADNKTVIQIVLDADEHHRVGALQARRRHQRAGHLGELNLAGQQ